MKTKVRQFDELKSLLGAAKPPKKKRALATEKKPQRSIVEKDLDFSHMMRAENVRPLLPPRHRHIEPSRVAPVPQQHRRDEHEALTLAKFGEQSKMPAWEIGQEWEDHQSFLRIGISPDVLRKLRRGHWIMQSEIDLHGMTSEEARDALQDFLIDARMHGLRCVRVVHGKGLTSPGKTPVLKGKVRRWLMFWDDVLAYCEPTPHAGGSGAVLVLLRGR
ncbi:MAG: Smr/MutS family protein [Burkholderiales bacterium]|jgi:DNA-nicking Smr family endonuclease|nr:Smr/MutS family protein [Burkholderiales bacterium]